MEQNLLVGRFIKDFDRIHPPDVGVMPVLEYDESIVDTFADVRERHFHVISSRTKIPRFQGPLECEGAASQFDKGLFELTSSIRMSYFAEFWLRLEDDTFPREVTRCWGFDFSDDRLCMLVIEIGLAIEVVDSFDLKIKVGDDR